MTTLRQRPPDWATENTHFLSRRGTIALHTTTLSRQHSLEGVARFPAPRIRRAPRSPLVLLSRPMTCARVRVPWAHGRGGAIAKASGFLPGAFPGHAAEAPAGLSVPPSVAHSLRRLRDSGGSVTILALQAALPAHRRPQTPPVVILPPGAYRTVPPVSNRTRRALTGCRCPEPAKSAPPARLRPSNRARPPVAPGSGSPGCPSSAAGKRIRSCLNVLERVHCVDYTISFVASLSLAASSELGRLAFEAGTCETTRSWCESDMSVPQVISNRPRTKRNSSRRGSAPMHVSDVPISAPRSVLRYSARLTWVALTTQHDISQTVRDNSSYRHADWCTPRLSVQAFVPRFAYEFASRHRLAPYRRDRLLQPSDQLYQHHLKLRHIPFLMAAPGAGARTTALARPSLHGPVERRLLSALRTSRFGCSLNLAINQGRCRT